MQIGFPFEDDTHDHVLAVVVPVLVEQVALKKLARIGERLARGHVHLDGVEHNACGRQEFEGDARFRRTLLLLDRHAIAAAALGLLEIAPLDASGEHDARIAFRRQDKTLVEMAARPVIHVRAHQLLRIGVRLALVEVKAGVDDADHERSTLSVGTRQP